jgi:hypothetical protein
MRTVRNLDADQRLDEQAGWASGAKPRPEE